MEWHGSLLKQNDWANSLSFDVPSHNTSAFSRPHLLFPSSSPNNNLCQASRLCHRDHVSSRGIYSHGRWLKCHQSRHHKSPHQTNCQPQLYLLPRLSNNHHSYPLPQRPNPPSIILVTHNLLPSHQIPPHRTRTTAFTSVWSIWPRNLWPTSKRQPRHHWCSFWFTFFPQIVMFAAIELQTFWVESSAGLQFHRLCYCSFILQHLPCYNTWTHILGFYHGKCGFSGLMAWYWCPWVW